MHNFQCYSYNTSNLHALLVILETPLPCLLCVILCDVIPLEAPEKGLGHSHTFWLRAFLITWFINFTVVDQCRHFIPALYMTIMQNVVVTFIAATGATASTFGLANVAGYPLPFIVSIGAPGDCALLLDYALIVAAQFAMTYLYPAYNYLFTGLTDSPQTVFAMLLPIMKIISKNWVTYVARNKEDFKPEVVIFNVEVFHALFVAYCMQHSTSIHTTVVLMFVDFVQACMGLYDANLMLKSLHSLLTVSNGSSTTQRPVKANQVAPLSLNLDSNDLDLLSTVAYVRSTDKLLQASSGLRLKTQDMRFRMHAVVPVMQQQHVKNLAPVAIKKASSSDHPTPTVQNDSSFETAAKETQAQTPPAILNVFCFSSLLGSVIFEERAAHATLLSEAEKQRLRRMNQEDRLAFVQQILQLLHFTEFLLLIEFTEVIIPAIYCAYLGVISYLPNRQFYASLRGLDDAAVQHNIVNVMIYASLEVLSFTMLSILLYKKLRVSPLKQLPFVLEKQWQLVQSKLILWVVFTVQIGLDHFGVDYSFQFVWLNKTT